jgi:predicted RNA-binding Zn-ribbon protein involved in translation (DUF1610 family)
MTVSTKTQEIRTPADVSIPCPDCGTKCRPDEVIKPQRKVTQPSGVTVVLPDHYLDLKCPNCHLEMWIVVDEVGKPITDYSLC